MKFIRRLTDRTEDCKRCLLKKQGRFLMEKDNGKQVILCGYHYGKERGYIK